MCRPKQRADDQSFYHSATLLSSFQHTPNNFRCRFRQVRSYDKEVITRLFSYQHLYQALGSQFVWVMDAGQRTIRNSRLRG